MTWLDKAKALALYVWGPEPFTSEASWCRILMIVGAGTAALLSFFALLVLGVELLGGWMFVVLPVLFLLAGAICSIWKRS